MAPQRLLSNAFGVVVIVVLGLLSTTTVSAAKNHTYPIGWAIPPHLKLGNLTQNATIGIGDKLIFTYNKTVHDLLLVHKKDNDSCNATDPIQKWTDGHSTVHFNESGHYYFICGYPHHCKKGQFLSVVVKETAKSPPPGPPSNTPPPPSPPSPPSEGPSEGPSNSTAPPPSRSDANGLRPYVTTWVVIVGAGLLALGSL